MTLCLHEQCIYFYIYIFIHEQLDLLGKQMYLTYVNIDLPEI